MVSFSFFSTAAWALYIFSFAAAIDANACVRGTDVIFIWIWAGIQFASATRVPSFDGLWRRIGMVDCDGLAGLDFSCSGQYYYYASSKTWIPRDDGCLRGSWNEEDELIYFGNAYKVTVISSRISSTTTHFQIEGTQCVLTYSLAQSYFLVDSGTCATANPSLQLVTDENECGQAAAAFDASFGLADTSADAEISPIYPAGCYYYNQLSLWLNKRWDSKGFCSGVNVCICAQPCEKGMYSSGTGCLDCPAGYFSGSDKASECTACLTGKSSSKLKQTSAESCVSCVSGFYSDSEGSIECTACSPGLVMVTEAYGSKNADDCVACKAGRWNGEDGQSGSCKECESGKFSEPMASQCSDCTPGTFLGDTGNSGPCKNCEPGKFTSLAGASFCQLCRAGTSSKGGNRQSCPSCDPGFWQDEEGSTGCKECNIGKYLDSTGANYNKCKDCAQGTYASTVASSTCLHCVQGKFMDLTAGSSCKDCDSGQFANRIGMPLCTECPNGYFQEEKASNQCNACPTGWQQNQASARLCVECFEGKYTKAYDIIIRINRSRHSKKESDGDPSAGSLSVSRSNSWRLLKKSLEIQKDDFVEIFSDPEFSKQLQRISKSEKNKARRRGRRLSAAFALPKQRSLVGVDGFFDLKALHSWKYNREVFRKSTNSTVVFLFLVHTPVSKKVFEFFNCDNLYGRSYMRADYSIECHTSTAWIGFAPYVVGVGLGFTLGLPLAISFYLWKNRSRLQSHVIKEQIGFLYDTFNDGAEWWEVHEILRKSTLTGLIIYVQNPLLQSSTALVISIVALVNLNYFKPHKSKAIFWLDEIAFTTTALMFHAALLLSVIEESSIQNTEGVGVFLIILNCSFFVSSIYCAYISIREICKGVKQLKKFMHPKKLREKNDQQKNSSAEIQITKVRPQRSPEMNLHMKRPTDIIEEHQMHETRLAERRKMQRKKSIARVKRRIQARNLLKASKMLEKISAFSSIGKANVDKIAKSLLIRNFEKGHVICKENDQASELYILLKGKVRVTKKQGARWLLTGEEMTLAELFAPSYFGEMALLSENSPTRTATVSVVSDSALLMVMYKEEYEEMISSNILDAAALDSIRSTMQDRFQQQELALHREQKTTGSAVAAKTI